MFKSEDAGQNWTAAGLAGRQIQALAIAPGPPATVYAGTAGGRVFSLTCLVLQDDLSFTIPCFDLAGARFTFTLRYSHELVWEADLGSLREITAVGECLSFGENLRIEFPCLDVYGTNMGCTFAHAGGLLWAAVSSTVALIQ